LEPGDEIFLYTDGVVEATNVNKELYGEDRLLEFIDHEREVDAKAVCEDVLVNVFEFFKGADQFDDITELSLKYLKKTN
ncbi:MAG: serine/threonine-protein phosphatase, partial [Erysipelotrichaceae bacterium]|nr:serine/threonine-protein phosphatase [Erysipelotrichaceae bacterium]